MLDEVIDLLTLSMISRDNKTHGIIKFNRSNVLERSSVVKSLSIYNNRDLSDEAKSSWYNRGEEKEREEGRDKKRKTERVRGRGRKREREGEKERWREKNVCVITHLTNVMSWYLNEWRLRWMPRAYLWSTGRFISFIRTRA